MSKAKLYTPHRVKVAMEKALASKKPKPKAKAQSKAKDDSK